MRLVLSLFFLFIAILAKAQFGYVLDQTIPVEQSPNKLLTMPWAGGLNATQYNSMDLNGDAIDDLVIFDRMADRVLTFINKNNQYVFSADYENQFPTTITNWLLLRDFNCDGKKDIFTGDILGIKVFKNVSDNKNIMWEPVLFSSGTGGSKSNVLLTKGFSDKINLQLQFDDLPSIADADGDGDLDIFNVRFISNGTIEFHKNFAMERFASCDSLDFERITQKWGDFTECECGDFAFHNDNCNSSGGRTQHAGGKSLLVLDVNGDTKQDILISEAECTRLSLLQNEGDLLNPIVNTDVAFPLTEPATFIYPSAYFEDVDFDGIKDLVVSTNIFQKESLNTNLAETSVLYHNNGTNENPNFIFTKNNFIQDQMLDFGDNAVPAFLDYDTDGDQDLFISHNQYPSSIKLYQNTGSKTQPYFSFIDQDFLNISSLSVYNLKIQFTDMNKDSKIDLAFTATSFEDNITRLYYVLNKISPGLDLSSQPIEETDFTLQSTENILLTEINGDGKIDLLLGKSNGTIEFWKNSGTQTPNFLKENENYLSLESSVLRQNIACAAADLNEDGNSDLILADQTGQLRIINNFKEAQNADEAHTDIIYDSLGASYTSPNLGGRLWPTVVDLFNNNKPSIVVGTALGGLRHLKNSEARSISTTPLINVFPNPILKSEILNVEIDRPALIQIYSILGHQISEPYFIEAKGITALKLPVLSTGVYILRITPTNNNKVYAKRFVIY